MKTGIFKLDEPLLQFSNCVLVTVQYLLLIIISINPESSQTMRPSNMRTIALAAFLASVTVMASALPTDGQMPQTRAVVVKARQEPAPNPTETTTMASTTPTSTSDSASCGVSDIFDCVKGLEKSVTSCATAASDWGAGE
ncbi:hypothetical protein F5876DRAFT_80546 [Lentinula aff. lateritia]|uniref:Uncharacterized protein n=1 Tax=Lentinula aff. lateritia TaxID=2804960 RepID=A0ACC1TPD9_9AGAR|nr:hypothetical protein F5876DRAFT_80546 [Lentinula aff. lateritia]